MFCLHAHLPCPRLRSLWSCCTDMFALFCSYHVLLLFSSLSTLTTPSALSTGDLLLTFQNSSQESLYWSPSVLQERCQMRWASLLYISISQTLTHFLLMISILCSPLHWSALCTKSISSFHPQDLLQYETQCLFNN